MNQYKSWQLVTSETDEDDTEDRVECPHCGKMHYPAYHDQEPCDDCCDKFLGQNSRDREPG